MKFLGIDYGERRVGIALSDDGGKIAFPKEILLNDSNLMSNIVQIVSVENVQEIVVGESLNQHGQPNQVENKIKIFIENLKKEVTIPIHREKEFFTSVEARKLRSLSMQEKKVDDSAAALMLQRYLDKQNNKNYDKYRRI